MSLRFYGCLDLDLRKHSSERSELQSVVPFEENAYFDLEIWLLHFRSLPCVTFFLCPSLLRNGGKMVHHAALKCFFFAFWFSKNGTASWFPSLYIPERKDSRIVLGRDFKS